MADDMDDALARRCCWEIAAADDHTYRASTCQKGSCAGQLLMIGTQPTSTLTEPQDCYQEAHRLLEFHTLSVYSALCPPTLPRYRHPIRASL